MILLKHALEIMGRRPFWLWALFVAAALWSVCAVFDLAGQRGLFFREGRELLSDFWMPKTCFAEGYGEPAAADVGSERVQSHWEGDRMWVAPHDRCYPAAALLPLVPFPASWNGAYVWSAFVALAFVASMCLIAGSWWPLLLLGSMPVIFNLERGNPIGLAAAGVGLFLAWYRSPKPWLRVAAALALSVATCFKISPVVLGVLYLPERDWKGVAWCVSFCSALFFVPWLLVPDGLSALPVMIANAKENFLEYARAAEFGFVDLWRAVRVAMHQDCMHLWPGCLAVTRLSQAAGLAAVILGAVKRDRLLVVGGMLWVAGNMHYYGALYLLPVFVLSSSERGSPFRFALWFVILCPLQLVIAGHSANAVLCNLALIALMAAGSQFRRRL